MSLAKVQNLVVFLASPGGLDSERDAVEAVASLVNAEIALAHGVVITVRRWEQMIGKAGNPQSQINSGVDDCEVFIGVVYRRWGTATGNGYDSGFGEEFARALDRWERTGAPRIALFFKQIDEESLRDPGEQLKRVLGFRKSIEDGHTAFFNVFESTDELKTKVFQLFAEAVVRLPAQAPIETGGAAKGAPTGTLRSGTKSRLSKISTVLEAFADVTAGRQTDIELDVDRLELFGLAASRDNDTIPTHLANRIFNRRAEISFQQIEVDAWFRTYLVDVGRASKISDRVIPFASIAGGVSQLEKLLQDSLGGVMASDDMQLVAGWLRLATALKVRPKGLWPAPPLDSAQQAAFRKTWSHAATLNRLAITYWLSVRRRQDLQLARVLASSEGGVAILGEPLVGLLRRKPDAAPLARSVPDLLIDQSVLEIFGESGPFATLSDTDLEDLALRRYLDDGVRLGALDELIRRDAVPSAVIEAALKGEDSSPLIGRSWSAEASERLFNRSVSSSFLDLFMVFIDGLSDKLKDPARVALARMARHNIELDEMVADLMKDSAYLSPDDASMLFSRYEGSSEVLDVAESLLNGTNAEAVLFIDSLRGAGASAETLRFVQSRFEIAAIKYISTLADGRSRRSQLKRLRQLAAAGSVYRFEATDCLIEILEDEDIDFLIGRLAYMSEAGSSHALSAIARVSTLKRLNQLLTTQDEKVVVMALMELRKRNRLPSRTRLMDLMYSNMQAVRIAACAVLMAELDRTVLPDTLRKYVSGGKLYYYNVVCEFDREIAEVPSAFPES